MRQLTVFNSVTIDGYFADPNGDISWAYQQAPDAEWDAFVAGNAQGGGQLLLGRITYEMMARYWPTPDAHSEAPLVADGINNLPKLVVSRTLQSTAWQNTRLINGDLIAEVLALKQQNGPSIVILGSGSIIAQLSQAHLIDEYQLVVNPVVLGAGRTIFDGLTERLALKLSSSRTFKNGNLLVSYTPRA